MYIKLIKLKVNEGENENAVHIKIWKKICQQTVYKDVYQIQLQPFVISPYADLFDFLHC